MTNIIRGAAIAFLFALSFTLSIQRAAAETPQAICGKYLQKPQPGVDIIVISCADFTALRKVAPDIPWPDTPRTEVLIHLAQPGAVRVTVGDQERWAEVIKDAYGHWVALLKFEGIAHTSYAVKIWREPPE